MSEEKKKPDLTVREGGMSLSIWYNEDKPNSIKLQKSWQDKKTEEWNNESMWVFENQLCQLVSVCTQLLGKKK